MWDTGPSGEAGDLYRHLLESSSLLAAACDFEGNLLFVAGGWHDVLGHSPDRLIGTPYRSLVHPDDIERVVRALAALKPSTMEAPELEMRVHAHDGSYRWMTWMWRSDALGRRLYGIGRDVTESHLREQELIRARESALDASREKSRVLAHMSAEIRTPITRILEMVSLALSTPHNERQREYLEAVQKSAERLVSIADRILDLSKDDAERMPAAGEPISPSRQPPPSLRVLVAEDHVVSARLATGMLQSLGCTVQLAENGSRAVELTDVHDFDLILMDVDMPEMDGLEATRLIRHRERERGLRRRPIIGLTANAITGDEQRCLAAGMDGYLAKPITIDALEREIRRFVATAG
jgi:PAS domain S-box-containing protein